mgnify:CR=1 FL=1
MCAHLVVLQTTLHDRDLDLVADLLAALGLVLAQLPVEVRQTPEHVVGLKLEPDQLLQQTRVAAGAIWLVAILKNSPRSISLARPHRLDHLQSWPFEQEHQDEVQLPAPRLGAWVQEAAVPHLIQRIGDRLRQLVDHLCIEGSEIRHHLEAP